jgi:hypothetical protein
MKAEQTLTDSAKINRTAIFAKALFAILRKSKREATPHKPMQVASHLLFPNPPKTFHYRSFLTLVKVIAYFCK